MYAAFIYVEIEVIFMTDEFSFLMGCIVKEDIYTLLWPTLGIFDHLCLDASYVLIFICRGIDVVSAQLIHDLS
jgi:hypothetical protein